MENIDSVIAYYKEVQWEVDLFRIGIESFFRQNPVLNGKPLPIIHSLKSRLKDPDHLRDKIERKLKKGTVVTCNNLFTEITDLCGVRVLHLYQDQFPQIHQEILERIGKNWTLVEAPKAYSWDPESKKMYDELNIKPEIKESYYTSVHYVIKLNNDSVIPFNCEIQVRTLFEEIWGEIDHSINYPHPTGNLGCVEQLRVMSKLVGTGTRLADSIYRTHNGNFKSGGIL